jgi:hypothetical protein
MKSTIKIVGGKRGWHLKVNGMFISLNFNLDIKAIVNEGGVPYGATEWVSIEALRIFWAEYREFIVASTQRPYKSVWGQLVKVN